MLTGCGLTSNTKNIKSHIQKYPAGKLLPMFHSPGDKYLDCILASGKITSNTRNNYFFYGRPSYCLLGSASKLRKSSFIFSFETNGIQKIYLFDSGGFNNYKLDKILGNDMEFYSLTTPDHINDVVLYFWGDLEAYAKCNPDKSNILVNDKNVPDELKTYAKLIVENSDPSHKKPCESTKDILTHTVEIQAKPPKDIKCGLLAIILPLEELYKTSVRKKINDLQCEVLSYVGLRGMGLRGSVWVDIGISG